MTGKGWKWFNITLPDPVPQLQSQPRHQRPKRLERVTGQAPPLCQLHGLQQPGLNGHPGYTSPSLSWKGKGRFDAPAAEAAAAPAAKAADAPKAAAASAAKAAAAAGKSGKTTQFQDSDTVALPDSDDIMNHSEKTSTEDSANSWRNLQVGAPLSSQDLGSAASSQDLMEVDLTSSNHQTGMPTTTESNVSLQNVETQLN
jgi:hypothetical protein